MTAFSSRVLAAAKVLRPWTHAASVVVARRLSRVVDALEERLVCCGAWRASCVDEDEADILTLDAPASETESAAATNEDDEVDYIHAVDASSDGDIAAYRCASIGRGKGGQALDTKRDRYRDCDRNSTGDSFEQPSESSIYNASVLETWSQLIEEGSLSRELEPNPSKVSAHESQTITRLTRLREPQIALTHPAGRAARDGDLLPVGAMNGQSEHGQSSRSARKLRAATSLALAANPRSPSAGSSSSGCSSNASSLSWSDVHPELVSDNVALRKRLKQTAPRVYEFMGGFDPRAMNDQQMRRFAILHHRDYIRAKQHLGYEASDHD